MWSKWKVMLKSVFWECVCHFLSFCWGLIRVWNQPYTFLPISFSSSPQIPHFLFSVLFLSLPFKLGAQRSCDRWIINSSNEGRTVWLSSPELLWQIWNNTRLVSNRKGVWKSKAVNCSLLSLTDLDSCGIGYTCLPQQFLCEVGLH